jgi:hypothetical protein
MIDINKFQEHVFLKTKYEYMKNKICIVVIIFCFMKNKIYSILAVIYTYLVNKQVSETDESP